MDRKEAGAVAGGSGRVFLGLGSNLGDREANIREAVDELEKRGAVRVLQVSPLYESEPVGWPGGPWYLNGAACGMTDLEPRDLLRVAKAVEAAMGRAASARNAPRPVDIDILLLEGTTLREPGLEIPHPRLKERKFVLRPLVDLDPGVEVGPGLSAREALDRLPPGPVVRPWDSRGNGAGAGRQTG